MARLISFSEYADRRDMERMDREFQAHMRQAAREMDAADEAAKEVAPVVSK